MILTVLLVMAGMQPDSTEGVLRSARTWHGIKTVLSLIGICP